MSPAQISSDGHQLVQDAGRGVGELLRQRKECPVLDLVVRRARRSPPQFLGAEHGVQRDRRERRFKEFGERGGEAVGGVATKARELGATAVTKANEAAAVVGERMGSLASVIRSKGRRLGWPRANARSRSRVSDAVILTGASRFTDDIALAGQLHAVVVRSPHAHARIRTVDAAAARFAPGVPLVLTAADLEGEVARPIPSYSRTPPFDIRGPDGAMAPDADQCPLAREMVRDAGQPVAFVVAETLGRAHNAAALVRIEWEPRAAAVGIEEALAPGAPRLWDDRPDNVAPARGAVIAAGVPIAAPDLPPRVLGVRDAHADERRPRSTRKRACCSLDSER